jgi:hypothetical protein
MKGAWERKGVEDDEDIPSIDNNIIKNKDATNIVCPVTWKRAKQLEKEIHSQVNANLILINDNISDHLMLPSCCLNILRNDGICPRAWDDDGFNPPTVWWSACCLLGTDWRVNLGRIMIGESYP